MQQESVGTFSLDDNVWQGVTITDSAAAQITRLMQQDPQVKGVATRGQAVRLCRVCLRDGYGERTRQ